MRRRLLALLVAMVGLLGGALLLASPASAHATVVGSTPVDGSRLKTAPASVEIDFDQPVTIGGSIAYLHVIDQVGRRVDTGNATHPGGDASKIGVALKPGLGDSTYTASFRVISADSHPVAGAIRFVVGNGALAAGGSAPSTVNHSTSFAFDVIRWFAFSGLALLGGGWIMFTVWPAGRDDRRARTLIWTGWWVSVLGAAAEVLIQGPYDAGSGLSTVPRWALLDATLHTDFGLAHSLRLICLGVLAAVLGTLLRWAERSRARLEELGGLLVVAIAVSFAASGHAESEHPQWLSISSDSLHLISMAAWVGGLVFLLAAVLPRREPDELREVLPVFSKVAYVCVATLAITGTYQAFLGVGSWRALALTSYGRLVLIKIVLFILLIALGNLSRVAVQRRFGRPLAVAHAMADSGPALAEAAPLEPDDDEFEPDIDDSPEIARLRRSVLVEIVVASVVLAFTAVLVAEPPGQAALITIDSRPQTVTAQLDGGRTAAITLSSSRPGDLAVSVALSPGPKPQQVTLTAALPSKQLGPINVPLTATSTDNYSASGVLFPSAGTWVLTLTVQTSEFDSTVTNVNATLH